jgi:hypothetical protein
MSAPFAGGDADGARGAGGMKGTALTWSAGMNPAGAGPGGRGGAAPPRLADPSGSISVIGKTLLAPPTAMTCR